MEHVWRTIKNLSKFLRLHTVLVSPLYLQQLASLRHNTAVLLYDYNVVRRGGGGRWLLGVYRKQTCRGSGQTSPGFYGRRHLLSKEVQCGDNRGWILNLFCKLLQPPH